MNRRPPGLQLSIAFQGFLQYKDAEGLSPRTIYSYKRDLELWVSIQGDKDVAQVTTRNLRDYLTYLRTDCMPCRMTAIPIGRYQRAIFKSGLQHSFLRRVSKIFFMKKKFIVITRSFSRSNCTC